jgi:hypothetical protein
VAPRSVGSANLLLAKKQDLIVYACSCIISPSQMRMLFENLSPNTALRISEERAQLR